MKTQIHSQTLQTLCICIDHYFICLITTIPVNLSMKPTDKHQHSILVLHIVAKKTQKTALWMSIYFKKSKLLCKVREIVWLLIDIRTFKWVLSLVDLQGLHLSNWCRVCEPSEWSSRREWSTCGPCGSTVTRAPPMFDILHHQTPSHGPFFDHRSKWH